MIEMTAKLLQMIEITADSISYQIRPKLLQIIEITSKLQIVLLIKQDQNCSK